MNPAFAFEEERRLFGKIEGQWFEQKFEVIDEFVLELDAFSDCIRHGRKPEADGMEGLRDIAAIEAIYRSARENRPIAIEGAAGEDTTGSEIQGQGVSTH